MTKINNYFNLTVFFFILLIINTKSFSQEAKEDYERNIGRPDLPGNLNVDIGWSFLRDNKTLNTSWWNSRTVNIYYSHEIRISKSKFYILPGVGLGLDRYRLSDNITLKKTLDKILTIDSIKDINVKKSLFITNYVDIPFEIRFVANPKDVHRSFNASLIFKVGWRFSSHTKIKKDDLVTKEKFFSDYNLNNFRYGITGKIGIGDFQIFYFRRINDLFKNNEGPNNNNTNNFTIGLTFTAF